MDCPFCFKKLENPHLHPLIASHGPSLCEQCAQQLIESYPTFNASDVPGQTSPNYHMIQHTDDLPRLAVPPPEQSLETTTGSRSSPRSPVLLVAHSPSEVGPFEYTRLSCEAIVEKLRRFFRTRPTIESLKEKGIYKPVPVFGSSLLSICQLENSLVPKFIRTVTELIEEKGLEEVGLYRISATLSAVKRIRCQVDQASKQQRLLRCCEYTALVCEEDVHVLTGALKLFFRELAEPLFTPAATKYFLTAIKIQSPKQRFKRFDELLKGLPAENKETLKMLLRHLDLVAAHSDKNGMPAGSLAIAFGPTLFHNGDKNKKEEPAPVQSNSSLASNMIMQGKIVEYLLKEHSKFEALQDESDHIGPDDPPVPYQSRPLFTPLLPHTASLSRPDVGQPILNFEPSEQRRETVDQAVQNSVLKEFSACPPDDSNVIKCISCADCYSESNMYICSVCNPNGGKRTAEDKKSCMTIQQAKVDYFSSRFDRGAMCSNCVINHIEDHIIIPLHNRKILSASKFTENLQKALKDSSVLTASFNEHFQCISDDLERMKPSYMKRFDLKLTLPSPTSTGILLRIINLVDSTSYTYDECFRDLLIDLEQVMTKFDQRMETLDKVRNNVKQVATTATEPSTEEELDLMEGILNSLKSGGQDLKDKHLLAYRL